MKALSLALACLAVTASASTANAMCATDSVGCADVIFTTPIPLSEPLIPTAPTTISAAAVMQIMGGTQQLNDEPSKADQSLTANQKLNDQSGNALSLSDAQSFGNLAPSSGGECGQMIDGMLFVCGYN